MLVTPESPQAASGGRGMLAAVHRRCLEAMLGSDLLVQRLHRGGAGRLRWAPNAIRGYIDGVDQPSIEAILAAIPREQVDRVYLDGSNLGIIARVVKERYPHVEVLTFCHNVEARFFLGSFRRRKSLRAAGIVVANYLAERSAVRHSDRLIALSERDSRLLARLYGRGATDILSMAMQDKLARELMSQDASEGGDYILFVGGAFYANEAGSCWFVDNVVPEIGMKTYIVGRGMERLQSRLERAGKVEVVGPAEDLGEWYRNAKVVVAPIFDGSGMKTKIAEALMFGKKIVGTTEAFTGYEDVAGEVGWVCDTKEEFVSVLRSVEKMPIAAFNLRLRELFERQYSCSAACRGLANILGLRSVGEGRTP